MTGRFFLDTNIFVYSLDRSDRRKAVVADGLIGKALSSQKGIISFQVVQEFFNAAFKRFAAQMEAADGRCYLDEVFSPLLAVHASATLCGEALNLYAAGNLSWYDALIVAAALHVSCDVLYSEDLQHGRKFGNLRIVNPFL